MHMPVLYKLKETSTSDQERTIWHSIDSPAMLVQIPEPDFSMPFNVNAITFGVLGVFVVNMYNSLVKPKRFVGE